VALKVFFYFELTKKDTFASGCKFYPAKKMQDMVKFQGE